MMDAGDAGEAFREKAKPGRIVFCGDGYAPGTYEVHRERCGGIGHGIGLVVKHLRSGRWQVYDRTAAGDYRLVTHHVSRTAAGKALADGHEGEIRGLEASVGRGVGDSEDPGQAVRGEETPRCTSD